MPGVGTGVLRLSQWCHATGCCCVTLLCLRQSAALYVLAALIASVCDEAVKIFRRPFVLLVTEDICHTLLTSCLHYASLRRRTSILSRLTVPRRIEHN